MDRSADTNRTSLGFALATIGLIVITFIPLSALASGPSVVTNPTLVTGVNAIDPPLSDPNGFVLDATGVVTGAAAKTDLTSIPDFAAVQTFTGVTPRSTQGTGVGAGFGAVNHFDFTDPNRPDVRLTSTSGNASGGGADNSAGTSGTGPGAANEQYLGNASGSLLAQYGYWGQFIEFGTYDSGTGTFDPNRSVSAAGFMITRTASASTTWTATFYNSDNVALSTQTITTAGANQAYLFGYKSTSANIRRVQVVFTGQSANTFMDDLGFTNAPAAAPYAKPSQLNNLNGSFEDTTGGTTGPSAYLAGSNGSSSVYSSQTPVTVTGWTPYFQDPNNVVGRYGTSGSVASNSSYLDTVASYSPVIDNTPGTSDGSRRIILNSVDGYVNGVVSQNVLTGLDSRFLNPHVQIKIAVDVSRSTTLAANTNATATLALTNGVGAAATNLANAIASDSVNQGTLVLNTPSGFQLELNLTGNQLAGASQLNLLFRDIVNCCGRGF